MEIRAYVLAKFGYRCAYCGRKHVAFELDHIVPRSRGGSNRVSNLAASCHDCNTAKGNKTASEWGYPDVEARAKRPLKDAGVMNAMRFVLVERLRSLGLEIHTWSGGCTRWNRDRFGIEKAHCLDALCVGELAGLRLPAQRWLAIIAHGLGSYQRTNVDCSGFPRSYLTRHKRVLGFSTGDLVRAHVPDRLKTKAKDFHVGRVAVRVSGYFKVGKIDGIHARYCRLVQRIDGYEYQRV